MSRTLNRIEGLRVKLDNLKVITENAVTQYDYERLTSEVAYLESAVQRAWRELVRMGKEGEWDAIVEIAPLGPPGSARKLMFDTYHKWARERGMRIEMLHEPMSNDEPVVFRVCGDFAFGLLRLEAGHQELGRNRPTV